MTMEKGTKRLIVGATVATGAMLVGAGLVLGAGMAKADTGQNPYLSLLLDLRGDGFDISAPYDGRLIALADETCNYIGAGARPVSVANDLHHRMRGYWTSDEAVYFVVDAQFNVCPWTLSASKSSEPPMTAMTGHRK